EHDRGQGCLAGAGREAGEAIEFRGQGRPGASRARRGLRGRALRCNGLAAHGPGTECDAVLFIECGIPALFPGRPNVRWIMCTTMRAAMRRASQLSAAPEGLRVSGCGI